MFKRQCELAVSKTLSGFKVLTMSYIYVITFKVKHEKPIVLQCRMAEADCFRILQEVVPKDHFIHRHCLNERMENVQAMLDVSLVSKIFKTTAVG